MNLNPHRKNWFFPIEEAPAFATVTRNGTLRDVRVHHKKALIAADRGDTFSSNTMTDIASRPPQSPRFRRDRPTLERRAGAWLRDFRTAASQSDFSITAHLDHLSKNPASNGNLHR